MSSAFATPEAQQHPPAAMVPGMLFDGASPRAEGTPEEAALPRAPGAPSAEDSAADQP